MLSKGDANNVVFVPTTLTPLQRDISEALVQMFAPVLKPARPPRTAISRLLADSPDESTPEWAQPVEILYGELSAVCKHALLVVDHFVPRKLLLLEVGERLLQMSGKLAAFNRLIDHLVEHYERQPSTEVHHDYTILVIAQTVKELEWIEGVIVGKKLRYTNASGRRLFDAPEHVQPESVEDEMPNGRHRRARQQRAKGPRREVVVHLVTTRQAVLVAAGAVPLDMVFSFDASLDPGAPELEAVRVRARDHGRTPVVVPVPLFSVEHIEQQLPRPTGGRDELAAWKLAVVRVFAANRFRLFERGESFDLMHLAVARWALDWQKAPVPVEALLQKYKIATTHSDKQMAERLREDHLAPLVHLFGDWEGAKRQIGGAFVKDNVNDTTSVNDPAAESLLPMGRMVDDGQVPTDYHQCKRALALFLRNRMEQVTLLLDTGLTSVLPAFREAESARQVEIDADESRVADNFRKLRKLNEDATSVERKLARAESDHSRVAASEAESRNMLIHLEAVVRGDEGDMELLVAEQAKVMADLEAECVRLATEHSALESEAEELRRQYQTSSAEAVRATGDLSNAKACQTQLEKKLHGPGMAVLPQLARKDELAAIEGRMLRLSSENHFLSQLLARRLEKVVKDRTTVLESTSSGSSSRPTNRISRASTPMG